MAAEIEHHIKLLLAAYGLLLAIAGVMLGRWKIGDITRQTLQRSAKEWQEYAEARDKLLVAVRGDLTEHQQRLDEFRAKLLQTEAKVAELISNCHERDVYIRTLVRTMRESGMEPPDRNYEV